MTGRLEDLAEACLILSERVETLSLELVALTSVNAVLLRELAALSPNPLDYFSGIEAQIGGAGEAIALQTKKFTDVTVRSEVITEVYETILRQARMGLEALERAKEL